MKVTVSPHPPENTLFSLSFLNIDMLVGTKCYLIGLSWISLMSNDGDYLFMFISAICVPLQKYLVMYFLHLLFFYLAELSVVFMYSGYSPLSDYLQVFFCSVGVSSLSGRCHLQQKKFNFDEINITYFL